MKTILLLPFQVIGLPLITELRVLKKLGIEDFLYPTKDKVIAMASMLDVMDPETAKKQ